MKQTAKKKNKVFRTLIRRIRIDGKTIQNDSNGQSAGKKGKKQEGRPRPLKNTLVFATATLQENQKMRHMASVFWFFLPLYVTP